METDNTAYRPTPGLALATAFILVAVGVLGREGDRAEMSLIS